MSDIKLRNCPFCGSPAEIVECKAPEWHSGAKHVRIQCTNEVCMMHYHEMPMLTACIEPYCNTLPVAVIAWNTRKNGQTRKRKKE